MVGPGKLYYPGLVPEGFPGIRGKKSDMTAGSGRLQKQAVIAVGRGIGKTGGGKERVVQGIDEQCRYPDTIHKSKGAAAPPIIFGILESVDRGGIDVVEVFKGTNRRQPCGIDTPGIAARLPAGFGRQGA